MMHEIKTRTMRRDGESTEHWMYRIFVNGFYKYRDIYGRKFWLERWGPRPPDNEAEYNEPPDSPGFLMMVSNPPR